MSCSNLPKTLVLLIVSTAYLSGAAAADLSIDSPESKIVWKNADDERTVEASLACSSSVENMSMIKGGEIIANETGNGTEMQMQKDFGIGEGWETGDYTVQGHCDQDGSVEEKFYIAKMDMDIENPEYKQKVYRGYFMGDRDSELYKGDPVEVSFDTQGLENNSEYDSDDIDRSDFSVDVWIPGYENGKVLDSTFSLNRDNDELTVHPYIPSDIEGGDHGINMDIGFSSSDYGGFDGYNLGTRSDAIYLTGIRTDKIRPSRYITGSQVEDISVDIFVESSYRDYVSENTFDLKVDGETYTDIEFDLTERSDSGEYTLELAEKPEELPKESLEILYRDPLYTSGSDEEKVSIASYTSFNDSVFFEGYVWDSNKQPVSASFDIAGQTFSTDSQGFFSRKINPGVFDLSTEFSKGSGSGSINLKGVELKPRFSPEDSRIRYDYREDIQSIDAAGVDPLSLMAVVFRKPFNEKGSTVTMDFEVIGTGIDPTEVDVLSCDNWDIEQGKCLSSWSKIPDEDTSFSPRGGWSVQVPVESFQTNILGQEESIIRSAYAVGTQSGLRFNGDPGVRGTSNGRIAAGEEITFEGQIAGQLSDVEVDFSLVKNGEEKASFSDTTDEDGTFSASGDVPEEQGNYTVEVEASKEQYEDFETELSSDVWVYEEEELVLTSSVSQPDVSLVEKNSIELDVENTGQTKVSNIDMEASSTDIPEDSFRLSNARTQSLSPDESKTAELVFEFPEDYSPDSYYPDIELKAEAEGEKGDVRAEMTLRPVLTRAAQQNSQEEKEEGRNDTATGQFLSAPSLPRMSDVPGAKATGEFLASQSTLNIALGLIMIFLMVLAGAMKKKDSKSNTARRNVLPQQQSSTGSMSGNGMQPPKVAPAGTESERAGKEVEEPGTSQETDSEEQEEVVEEEDEDSDEQENSEADSSSDSDVRCDICDEEFDTEAGVKLHKQTSH